MSKAQNFSVVGKRVQRVEGFDKVTGDSAYIADIYLPGMLVGKVLRSPFPHARIRNIDISKAEKLPGVRAVVTAEDTIKRPWGAFFAATPRPTALVRSPITRCSGGGEQSHKIAQDLLDFRTARSVCGGT